MAERISDTTKTLKAWGGFVDGRLSIDRVDDGWGGFGANARRETPAVFLSRAKARACYADVRPVVISWSDA